MILQIQKIKDSKNRAMKELVSTVLKYAIHVLYGFMFMISLFKSILIQDYIYNFSFCFFFFNFGNKLGVLYVEINWV